MADLRAITGIYKIKCLANGRIYIGQTIDLKDRWYHHKRSLFIGRHYNSWLQSDWNLYGKDAFEFSVILSHVPEFLLDTAEQAWILYYRHHKPRNVYNMNDGGNNNRNPCQEIRDKISLALKGSKRGSPSPEHRKHLSESQKGQKRKPLTDEHKRKLSIIRKGRVTSLETREKISSAKKGKTTWNKGKKMNEDFRETMRQSWIKRRINNKG